MQLIRKVVPNDFNLFCFGDCHEGTILFHRHGMDNFIDIVNSPYEGLPHTSNFCVHHGDGIEAITVDDKRFDISTIDKDSCVPDQQAEAHVKTLMPITKKLVTILEGNHEAALRKYGNLTARMAKELCIPFGTTTAKISYVDGNGHLILKQFATHGRKPISSTADDPKRRRTNMELILKRHLKHKAGDCLLQTKGHTHRLLVCRPDPDLYLYDNGKEIHQKYTRSDKAAGYIHPDHRWYANTGSFYKLYVTGASSYAEKAEYDPVELGFVVVLIRDRKIIDIRKITL
jgi:hypothetical protein